LSDYLLSALSGWAGALVFGSGLAMPYLLRRVPGAKMHYLRRMWPHYWLGYLTFFASFAHAWFAMRSGNMRGMNLSGVWIATLALIVTLWQIVVGLLLRDPAQSKRRALRRLHFWTMALVAGLIVLHVALNRPQAKETFYEESSYGIRPLVPRGISIRGFGTCELLG
jgi:cytochrome b561